MDSYTDTTKVNIIKMTVESHWPLRYVDVPFIEWATCKGVRVQLAGPMKLPFNDSFFDYALLGFSDNKAFGVNKDDIIELGVKTLEDAYDWLLASQTTFPEHRIARIQRILDEYTIK